MADISQEAVQAASRAIERVMQEAAHPLSYEEMGKAAAKAAAPFLAEHIAGLIRERGLEAALDCWCHDTYADLALAAFPKETNR